MGTKLDKATKLAGKVSIIVIALAVLGFVFNTRLGRWIWDTFIAATGLAKQVALTTMMEIAVQLRRLRWVVYSLLAAVVLGLTIGLIGKAYGGAFVAVTIITAPAFLIFLFSKAFIYATLDRIKWRDIGPFVATAICTFISILATVPALIAIFLLYMWLSPRVLPQPLGVQLISCIAIFVWWLFMGKLLATSREAYGEPRAMPWFRKGTWAVGVLLVGFLLYSTYSVAKTGELGPWLERGAVKIAGHSSEQGRLAAREGAFTQYQNVVWVSKLRAPITKAVIDDGNGVRWWNSDGNDSLRKNEKVRVLLSAEQARATGWNNTPIGSDAFWSIATEMYREPVYAVTVFDAVQRGDRTAKLGWPNQWAWVPRSYLDVRKEILPLIGNTSDSPPPLQTTKVLNELTGKHFGVQVKQVMATPEQDGWYQVKISGKQPITMVSNIQVQDGDSIEVSFDPDQTIMANLRDGQPNPNWWNCDNGWTDYTGEVWPEGFERVDCIEKKWQQRHILRLNNNLPYFCAVYRAEHGDTWQQLRDGEQVAIDGKGRLLVGTNTNYDAGNRDAQYYALSLMRDYCANNDKYWLLRFRVWRDGEVITDFDS